MRLIAALVAVLVPFALHAREVTLSWQNPTSYTDDSPLNPGDIVSHRIQWTGDCPGFAFVAPENNLVVQGNATTAVVNVTPGSRCFRVFVTARTPGANETLESGASNVVAKAVFEDAKQPRPPSLLDAIIAWVKSIFARWA